MSIGVFEEEEHNKVCFKSFGSSCVPNWPKTGFWACTEGQNTWIFYSIIFSISSKYLGKLRV